MLCKNSIFYPEADSTNKVINNYADYTLVLAYSQKAGRGRWGKTWSSPEGGLYFSYKLPIQDLIYNKNFISIWVGIILHKVLTVFSPLKLKLKYPNDILDEDDNKIAGILIESRDSSYVIGIGINTKLSELEENSYSHLNLNPNQNIWLIYKFLSELHHSLVSSADEKSLLQYWWQNTIHQKGLKIKALNHLKEEKVIGFIEKLDEYGKLWLRDEKNQLFTINMNDFYNIRNAS